MKDIIAIVFFAELANASKWIEIYLFAKTREEAPRNYLEPPDGIPSHDTIERVFALISPEYLREFRERCAKGEYHSKRDRNPGVLADR
jgi:hypothetical protein